VELSNSICRYQEGQFIRFVQIRSCMATYLLEPQTTALRVRSGPVNPMVSSSLGFMTRSVAKASP
jgi:hypothetical protein